ncbi:MAG: PP2C family protein-serine/threonine phosphatase, partial [Planctomycetota bacterium]
VESFEPEESCHTFAPGERLVLYTDGITDAMNADGERFDTSRLHEVVNLHYSDDADTCADGVFRTVAEFRGEAPQTDDETIVVIDRV